MKKQVANYNAKITFRPRCKGQQWHRVQTRVLGTHWLEGLCDVLQQRCCGNSRQLFSC